MSDKTWQGRRRLARALLDAAAKDTANPTEYFILLNGAIESGVEGQSMHLAFEAIDLLSAANSVDGLGLKADAVLKLWSKTPTPTAASVGNVQAAFDVIDELLNDDDLPTLTKIAASLRRAASAISDPELKAAATARAQEATTSIEARQRLNPAFQMLMTSPADPAANQAVGSYFCFTRGNWVKGLPLLAKGNDASLKALAAEELSASDNIRLAAAADGWWNAAEKSPPAQKAKMLQHAAALYTAALETLTGLQRIGVEKKLASAPPESGRRIDLLDICNPADSDNAIWKLIDGTLCCEAKEYNHIDLLYSPPQEYDFRITFTVVKGNDSVNQICYANGHQFEWGVGADKNTFCELQSVDRTRSDSKNAQKQASRWLAPGRRFTSMVKVRKNGVEGYLNDKLIVSWKTDYTDLSLPPPWQGPHDNTLGVAAWNMAVRFDEIEVIELRGHGSIIK